MPMSIRTVITSNQDSAWKGQMPKRRNNLSFQCFLKILTNWQFHGDALKQKKLIKVKSKRNRKELHLFPDDEN